MTSPLPPSSLGAPVFNRLRRATPDSCSPHSLSDPPLSRKKTQKPQKRIPFRNLPGIHGTQLKVFIVESCGSTLLACQRPPRSRNSLLGAPIFNRLRRVPPDSRTPYSPPNPQAVASKLSALLPTHQPPRSLAISHRPISPERAMDSAQGQPSLSEATLGIAPSDRKANPSPRRTQHPPAASAIRPATHRLRIQPTLQYPPSPSLLPFLRLFAFLAAIPSESLSS
jgi:hypothetical protein